MNSDALVNKGGVAKWLPKGCRHDRQFQYIAVAVLETGKETIIVSTDTK